MKFTLKSLITLIILELFNFGIPKDVLALGVCGDPPTDFGCLNVVFYSFLYKISGGIIIVLFVMIISGGFKWLTSSGDPKDIENAKGRITYAIMGLGIIIFSWIILNFINFFVKGTILEFQIPT